MSRALNPEAIAALKTGNHQQVFDDIADVLTYDAARPARLEIEILSGFGFDTSVNLLRTENAVAIPKLRLVQAFFVARGFLQQHGRVITGQAASRSAAIRRATAVCLMMDAENLTAANTRKRLLVAEIQEGIRGVDGAAELLRGEKWLLDSILTSWLHRHTKSPTLWSHRRWLVGEFKKHGLAGEIVVADEIASVIGAAGERHPRNYYAWNHARGLVTGFSYNAPDVVAVCKKWAWKHHGDVSGWSFLLFALQRHGADDADMAGGVIAETEGLAESLQWRNESVWWFLRTLVGERARADENQALVALGRRLFEDETREGSEEEREVWQRTMKWLQRWE